MGIHHLVVYIPENRRRAQLGEKLEARCKRYHIIDDLYF